MKNLYFEISKKSVLSDYGWPYVSYKKTFWERIDDGVWQNLSSKKIASRQVNGFWLYDSKTYDSLRDCIVSN